MKIETIYAELKVAIADFVSQQADESLKLDLKIAVEKYFEEEISRYTKEELLKYLDKPEKVIRHFKDYLAGKDCVLC